MEEIRIPNDATYAPFSLMDVIATAPVASRLLLGATLPGRVLSAAALGLYAGSAIKDWSRRRDMKWIDFQREFGADVTTLEPMPEEERRAEIVRLAERLNDGYTAEPMDERTLARAVNRRLADYIAGITGQRVHTSAEVRDFTIARVIFPFAMGVCDIISGDVAIFRHSGVLHPHILCHEFVHRVGYWKELHAQAISYFALVTSGEPVMVQSALAERLHRQLKVLAPDDREAYYALVDGIGLREELAKEMYALKPEVGAYEGAVGAVMKRIYEERLKLTGQNGISDYDVGFTNLLWTFSRSATALQDKAQAEI
ncbi:MAG: DUF3810 family protein [Gemmatimonadales bacterium]